MGRISETAEALKVMDLPARLGEVLRDPRFWTEACLRTYLDLCDAAIFEDPGKGLKMARVAPRLVARLSKASRISKLILEIRSLAVHASACRATGQLQDAERLYLQAFEIGKQTGVPLYEIANLYRRQAVLRVEQQRLDEALECASKAVRVLRAVEGKEARVAEGALGAALLTRGVVCFRGSRIGLFQLADAVRDFSEALTQCHPGKSPRVFFSATHNLSVTILEGANRPQDLQLALRCIEQSQKLLRRYRVRRKSIADAKLRWLKGLILMRFGSTQRAEQLLVGARHDLIELDAILEVALISLDLGELYLLEGRWGTLRMIAEEVLNLRVEAYDHEILSALLLWKHAIKRQNLTTEMISFARQRIVLAKYPLSIR